LKILFVSRARSSEQSSYNHRLLMLYGGLRRLGMEADFLHMGDLIRPEPAVVSPFRFSRVLSRIQQYDVIHAGTALAAFPFCVYRRRFKATLIHDMHGHSSEMLMKLQLERRKLKSAFLLMQSLLLEEMTIHHSDYHLVVSRPLMGKLLAHGIPESRALLLRNGVDVQMFKPGDFQVWQGVDLLIEAAQKSPDKDIRFQFIGFRETAEHCKWKEKIHASLGSRAQLTDRVSQQDLTGLLRAADLLVLPRPYHPATAVAMPTKFAEYNALGKAVLVTDVDETASFVRQDNCGLVCRPSASGLAEGIAQARRMGPEKLSDMGQRGRRLAESTFSWEVICRRYHDFLQTIDCP